ncbi:hypothetical protein GCM10010372_28360 [Streptomyces tauricus]|uniref:hypothetical protein n=1 Tax=Streptomyces tauricus TaxID=68274 RepID=UPI001679C464|nr:hypothetical protein [Streptomyces tauricus]GHA26869.1 hypothetical protein GCM10010372_28360 [Streptomyces tauricus]
MTRTNETHTTVPDLSALSEYPAAWTHTPKAIFPGPPLVVPGACLKWYDIRRADDQAAPHVTDEARAFLTERAAAKELEFRGELGFVLLHLDGGKYYMLVCVWRDRDEMWQGLFYKDDEGFQPYPPKPGLLRPTQNVVELDATSHERRGWSRYLRSARDTAAKQAYLDDACTGELV